MFTVKRFARLWCLALGALFFTAHPAAAERLCDTRLEDCRTPLLERIQRETQGLDVAMSFITDQEWADKIIDRHRSGVRVRVLIDSHASAQQPRQIPILASMVSAGVPMRDINRDTGAILHWKMMLFAGQGEVEFSAANFGDLDFGPPTRYGALVETVYFSDDPAVVNSFKRAFDDRWTDAYRYLRYSGPLTPPVRAYPTYPIDPEMNFVPQQDFANRSVQEYLQETVGFDVHMYRIEEGTEYPDSRRHTDTLINKLRAGVPVRLITEPNTYNDDSRFPRHRCSVNDLYAAGARIKFRRLVPDVYDEEPCAVRCFLMHQKSTILRGRGLVIFGSSNWGDGGADRHDEHNYFTRKPYFQQFFRDQFERRWNSFEYEDFTPAMMRPCRLPAVRITSPPDGAVFTAPATITGVIEATDGDGRIDRVEIYANDFPVATLTSAPYTLTASGVPAGTYVVTARAVDDAAQATVSRPVTIIVNAAPSVVITSPPSGSVYAAPATITATINAADADGTIDRVELYANDFLIATLRSAPYTLTASGVGPGTYVVTARAVDNRGAATTSSPVTITVR